jgi:hypothetical protein
MKICQWLPKVSCFLPLKLGCDPSARFVHFFLFTTKPLLMRVIPLSHPINGYNPPKGNKAAQANPPKGNKIGGR